MSDSDGSDLGAIQEKVHIRKQALESSDLCSAQRPRLLGELGDALMALYNATGNVSTLEDVITAQDSALLLWGSYDNGRMDSLNNLGTALFVFCFNHEPSHFRIHRCVSVFREVLNLTSLDSPERLDAVRDLVEALGYVFEHFGGQETLAEAITLHREALQLCPPGSTRREACLNDLGCKLETRFKSEGNLEALKESVSMHREALALRPFGHPKRDFSANNLANALMSLADQEGGDNLLDEAIALQREALESRPAGHSLRVSSLTNLALALNDMSARGGHTASTELLSEAVDLLREALDLRPVGHSMRHTTLGNLAIVLIAQFRLVGHPDILGDAIELYREAAQLCTPGDPFRAHRLINLSGALFTRYEEQGGSDTLSEAITLGREAVSLSPRGNPYRQTALNTLAISLKAAFYQHSQPDTLTEAMGYLREALSLCPPAHPFRDGLIHNLADLLSILWRVQGDSDALDEAIILSRQALQLLPSGHPYRFLTLGQFGSLMRTKDVCAAVAAYKEALALCPHGQPSRASLLSGIAQCHLLSDTPVFDLPLALKYLSEAVAHDSSSARDRLADALRDLRQAEDVHSLGTRGMETSAKAECDEQLMNVYIQAVRLLPRVGHLGLAHRRRLHAVSSSDDLARNGAARALLLDRIPDAVEVLEEGRGVLWWQALHLRTSFLEGVPAEERAELEQIFRTLDAGSQDVSADIFTGQQREREIESRRHLSDRAETLLARVRLYPGLARTLMPAAFNTLMQSLPTGFVVIVNEAQPSCHALLLNARTKLAVCLELHPLRIQLDSGNLKAGVPRGVSALGAGDEATGLLHDTRAIRVSAKTSDAFEHTLARLWTYVVQPVIDRLGLKASLKSHRRCVADSASRDRAAWTARVSGGV
jgi:tetratricopeptide (TPR) repeat protein